ncbi:hypothetical protein RM553_14650 [Zunongwangia sp. F363]|uniref:Uncharacterized protein n=1 Tax=Autumnicola tepida TaxID=3075595 RepID=A0ABU3CCL0_9FLAO|nr:hypothetical protein [Zunongwangia sp. F363]MDT0644074.1 hypothetical protein [Zunongwangia sp. F363]
MAKGYMYIVVCSDGSYYTGSTKFLKKGYNIITEQEHDIQLKDYQLNYYIMKNIAG